jgi:hypothetical protein
MIFIFIIFFEDFFWGASPGSAGCFKKLTQIPNAGHPIYLAKKNIFTLKLFSQAVW